MHTGQSVIMRVCVHAYRPVSYHESVCTCIQASQYHESVCTCIQASQYHESVCTCIQASQLSCIIIVTYYEGVACTIECLCIQFLESQSGWIGLALVDLLTLTQVL